MSEGKYLTCFICREKKMCFSRFSMVNPITGKSHGDVFINERTGNENHPWPKDGSWVNVCRECMLKGIGLREHR